MILNRWSWPTLVLAALLPFSPAPVQGQPANEHQADSPTALEIKRELETKPVSEHWKVYDRIINDTSVLKDPALRNKLVRLADEVWYNRYLRGNHELRPGANPLPVETKETAWSEPRESYKLFSDVALHLDGKDFVTVWLKIIPGRQLNVPDTVWPRLKRSGRTFLSVFLKNAHFETGKNRSKEKRTKQQEYRFMTGVSRESNTFMQVLYETNRSLTENEMIRSGLKGRMRKFFRRVLVANSDIPMLKTPSVAFFLDNGKSVNEVKRLINQPSRKTDAGGTISSETIIEAIIKAAKEMRSEYPRWPIDETSGDDEPNQGKGHDQAPGKGHDKKKGEGHKK